MKTLDTDTIETLNLKIAHLCLGSKIRKLPVCCSGQGIVKKNSKNGVLSKYHEHYKAITRTKVRCHACAFDWEVNGRAYLTNYERYLKVHSRVILCPCCGNNQGFAILKHLLG